MMSPVQLGEQYLTVYHRMRRTVEGIRRDADHVQDEAGGRARIVR